MVWPCCRTHEGDVILPQEARELLANLSVGSSDIQPPGLFHYLPHLIGKPQGLQPALKLSQGRMGGESDVTSGGSHTVC